MENKKIELFKKSLIFLLNRRYVNKKSRSLSVSFDSRNFEISKRSLIYQNDILKNKEKILNFQKPNKRRISQKPYYDYSENFQRPSRSIDLEKIRNALFNTNIPVKEVYTYAEENDNYKYSNDFFFYTEQKIQDRGLKKKVKIIHHSSKCPNSYSFLKTNKKSDLKTKNHKYNFCIDCFLLILKKNNFNKEIFKNILSVKGTEYVCVKANFIDFIFNENEC